MWPAGVLGLSGASHKLHTQLPVTMKTNGSSLLAQQAVMTCMTSIDLDSGGSCLLEMVEQRI